MGAFLFPFLFLFVLCFAMHCTVPPASPLRASTVHACMQQRENFASNHSPRVITGRLSHLAYVIITWTRADHFLIPEFIHIYS